MSTTDFPELPDLSADEVPSFVNTDEKLFRWRLAWGVAERIAERPDAMLTRMIYLDDRIATVPDSEPPGDMQEAVWTARLHPRDRRGRWMKAFHMHSPGVEPGVSEQDLAPFDAVPQKGAMAQDVLGDAFDTKELHRGGRRGDVPELQYTPERMRQVHDPIIAATIDAHRPQAEPHILIVAGGPASGKTTFVNNNPQLMPADAVHIDADQVKGGTAAHHGIPEYRDMADASDMYAARGVHAESGDIVKKIMDRAMSDKLNIVLDATGDRDPGTFARELRTLVGEGYKVDVVYVSLPTDTASSFNLQRAMREHRYVPTPVLRNYHRNVAVNYRDEIRHMSELNSLRVFDRRVGLVAEMRDGNMVTVHEGAYKDWLAKAGEPVHDVPGEPRRELAEAQQKLPPRLIVDEPFDIDEFMPSRLKRGPGTS